MPSFCFSCLHSPFYVMVISYEMTEVCLYKSEYKFSNG